MMENDAQMAATDESLAAMEGLVSKERIEKIMGDVNKEKAGTEKSTEKSTEKTEEPAAQVAGVSTEKTEQPGKTEQKPIVIDTPFGKKTMGQQAEEMLKSFEDVQAFAKNYGLEIKEVSDFKKVFDAYKESNIKAQEGEQYKLQAQQYDTIFKGLPEEVSAMVYAHLNGQDYKEILKSLTSSIDYSKDFGSHEVLNLVNHYTEHDFDKETWEELEEGVRKSLQTAAKRAYQSDQTQYKRNMTEPQKNAEEYSKKFAQSVDESIVRLRTTYPDMGKSQIERVRQLMVNDLYGSLFNEDNTYKPDAAVRIAMQEFAPTAFASYEHTIADIVKMYESRGESKATERILLQSDKRDESGRNAPSGSEGEVLKVAKQMTSFLGAR